MSLLELIQYARFNSPFYRDLYQGLPDEINLIEALPILDQDEFWAANDISRNRLLTSKPKDGIILKSGGTTGKPKFSVFSRDEWSEFTKSFANRLIRSGLKDGDRVANLFYVGELYGSFLFTHRVLEECPVRLLQLPIAGITPIPTIIRLLEEYEATVIAGLPTTLLTLASQSKENLKIKTIFFAGEPMQRDQRAHMLKAFPEALIRSIGYASTDAGLLGFCDLECAPNEFRCFDERTIFEIIDEVTGMPIQNSGLEGRVVVTDLKRKLMPIIRYPVGDRAKWLEAEGTPTRKMLLLGRTEESARIGSITIHLEEIRTVLNSALDEFSGAFPSYQFQIVVVHRETRDGLVIRIASDATREMKDTCESEIIRALYKARPLYEEFVDQKKILPLAIEWREANGLEINSRTGKTRRVIDLRGIHA